MALACSPIGGSSTVLLGQLDSSTSQLSLVNLGDSAAMIFRPTPRRFARVGTILWPRLVARTHEQTHHFNCPYQVGADDMSQTVREGSPDEIQVRARAGDIIIAATDGVTDNLFDEKLQHLVSAEVRNFNAPHLTSPHLSAAKCLEVLASLASAVAKEAVRVGERQDDPTISTPFSVNASMEGYQAPGGKLDDVAVVVGIVREGAAEETWRGDLSSNFQEE